MNQVPLDYQNVMYRQGVMVGNLDMDQDFWPIFWECRAFTMTSIERMYALHKATRYLVETKTPGSFVECGVWAGGSAMVIAATCKMLGENDREIVLFDTFEGHTEQPDPQRDIDVLGGNGYDEWVKRKKSGTLDGWGAIGVEEVGNNITSTGFTGTLRLVKGPIERTASEVTIDQIALLRLDLDWYAPTVAALHGLEPSLERGGILIADDYGHYIGQRLAVDEYFQGRPVLLNRVDYSCRMMVKP